MNKFLIEATKKRNTAILTLLLTTMFCANGGMCQQLGLSLIFHKYKDIPGYSVMDAMPGFSLSYDNINFGSEKKKFIGGQLGFIPEIYITENATIESLRIQKFVGSVYAGRLLKLSNVFFLSGSVGGNLGYGHIKSWENNDWIKVPQFLVGLRTAEQLHIRVKRSAIILGFEQWLMINSSSISSFKFGYSFNLGKK